MLGRRSKRKPIRDSRKRATRHRASQPGGAGADKCSTWDSHRPQVSAVNLKRVALAQAVKCSTWEGPQRRRHRCVPNLARASKKDEASFRTATPATDARGSCTQKGIYSLLLFLIVNLRPRSVMIDFHLLQPLDY